MTSEYDAATQVVKNAIEAVYENKQVNKKNDITGDFSTDNESYPTAKAVKAVLNGKLDTTHTNQKGKNVVTDSNGNISFENKPTVPVGEDTDSNINMDGTGDAGTSSKFARADHVHPSDTSKASSTHTHGNISNDGKVGSASGKIITTGTGGAVQASDSISKNQISDFPSTMTPSSHTHGDITNDGKIGSTANKPIITGTNGKLAAGSFGSSANTFCEGNDSRLSDARTPTAHEQATSTIKEASALSNIGTSANATQHAINDALNTIIGTLKGTKFIEITTDKGTASASTMGKLYIVSENSKVNVYYTIQSGSGSSATYSWQKMDSDILDEFSVAWNDVTGKPSSFTPSSHTHGNISNDGKVGSTSGKPLITGTGGAVQAGAFGTGSGQFAEGNHTHSGYVNASGVQSEITAFANALAATINPSS